jgi:DnaJ-class molecular chaperone
VHASYQNCCCSSFEYLQDKNPDNRAAAEAKFKDVSEAYEVRHSRGMYFAYTDGTY